MRFIFKLLAITALIFSLSCKAKGQEVLRNTSILNYQRGDHTFMHFGFNLGVNYMDYRMIFSGKNPLRAEAGKLEVGFLVGIISELRVTDDLGLRFLPGLEFATRRTIFTHVPEVEENKMENFNESVYITLPFMMKYKAKRINNFRPYMAAGPSLKYDFHGHRTIDPERGVYLRTKPVDVFLETALGCDFYLPYFKFGMELRFAWGLTDILVKKHDLKNPGYEMYTDALKKMKARMFTVCFNFE
ncbi:porin family protein [Odoribacter lunatus]|uniref:type IX secretion/gliding motility protein PorT/SprT n=1 Tax=Odoribacter lunatus TaxID=2941335 RepID=UPI00203D9352|nr:porin family protein [Odoribacter lunatus]